MDKIYRDYFLISIILIFTDVILPCTAVCPAGFTGPSCNKYNLAYMKHTEQREHWNSHSSHFAVDSNATTCTVHTTPIDNPWWAVDLGKDMYVDGMRLELSANTHIRLRQFIVEVQKDGENTWSTCYSRTATSQVANPLQITCGTRILGRKVRITANHNQTELELCDVGVYGSCYIGSYGDFCEESCGFCNPTNPICNTVTGRCPIGCDEGYQGSVCKEKCSWGFYGNCQSQCGKCRDNVTCIVYTGECPNDGVCEAGYQEPTCQQECADYKYGFGCLDCGHCSNSLPCNKENGTCNGCVPGYKYTPDDKLCQTECDDGTWGDTCIRECGFCYVQGQVYPGPCNKTTGQCPNGCSPGYKQTSECKETCSEGKWGLSCANNCGACANRYNETEPWKNTTCVLTDGSCPTGCWIGIQGVRCDRPCTPGTYGQNCLQLCGHCRNGDVCDRVTGTCPVDCADGYLGTLCAQECPIGVYGYKCSQTCPGNCASNCSATDGSCICKDGWTGTRCENVCPGNHYGKDCAFVCGNCKDGTSCRQTDGYCTQGCKQEWTGMKCIDKEIIESYTRSYADVIGGTIGGIIFLGLMIAFGVWVFWRYRKDKSIHIKALASSIRNSVRRLSIRGRQSLRRSIQRLSMRGRRQNDQTGLGNNAERPHMANGHKGNKHPRMYECVKIQSNTINQDDFPRIYLQLQEATPDGRTLLHDAFQSFLAQRPKRHGPEVNGNAGQSNTAYFDAGFDDVQLHADSEGTKIPAFLPLGSNLSGFLLVNEPAASDQLWNHLQQRQIETVISIGKEASYSWRPGERLQIRQDVVECIDVQLHGSHRETKLTVQRQGSVRRAVRHMELFFWNVNEKYPHTSTLLLFIETFQRLHQSQRERSILVNYINMYEQAVLFTLVASGLEIMTESKRADILRTVAIGGKATDKVIRDFEGFKFMHDVIFEYITSMDNKALRQQHQKQQYQASSGQPANQQLQNQRYQAPAEQPASQTRGRHYMPESKPIQYNKDDAPPSYDHLQSPPRNLQVRQDNSYRPHRASPGQHPTYNQPAEHSQRTQRSSPGQQQHDYQQSHNTSSDLQRQRGRQPESASYSHQQERSFRPITDDPKYPNTTTAFKPVSSPKHEEHQTYQHVSSPKQPEHPYSHLAPSNHQHQQYQQPQQRHPQRSPTNHPQPQAQYRARSKSDHHQTNDDDDDEGGFASRPRVASTSTVV